VRIIKCIKIKNGEIGIPVALMNCQSGNFKRPLLGQLLIKNCSQLMARKGGTKERESEGRGDWGV
jgi:hypothetical protein